MNQEFHRSKKIRELLTEETLDPANWESFRQLAHNMVDDMLNHLRELSEKPAWQPTPDEVKKIFERSIPMEPEGFERAYADFIDYVLPYPTGNLHPRFFGWVQGNGTPFGMMADMLASGLNPHMAGFNQAPALVEHQVLRWLSELMGMPADASGVLTSGGTVANLLGLAVARQAHSTPDIRKLGICNGNAAKMVCYSSTETHGWVFRALELFGLGSDSLRKISVDDDFRMNLDELRGMIQQDRANGFRPFCIIGNAGTVNTGAIDDLTSIAEICKAEDLWFHIDGAFGSLVQFAPSLSPLVAGLEKADSLALDLHKWGYLPFEVGCVLVRDSQIHQDTFSLRATYLKDTPRGVIAGGLPFADRGLELTRGFKALKVWMSFKAHGVTAIGRLIEQNVMQARYLASLIDETPELEMLASVQLNIVCFRFNDRSLPPDHLNELNQEILIRLQEQGAFVLSSTLLNGNFALRAAIVNHRTKTADIERIVHEVKGMGEFLMENTSWRNA